MKSYKIASYIAISAILVVAIATISTNQGLFSSKSLSIQQASAQHQHGDSTASAVATNEAQKVTLDGINLSFEVQPSEVHASDLTTIKMMITDAASGAPLSHTDWTVVITTPSGKDVYRVSTQHAHMGIMQLSYSFTESGKNTVHVQAASLGPKMMGMDVPQMALTRIFKSGDMMKSPAVDQTDFFGTRTTDFTVNVGGEGGVRVLDGSEPNTKVKLVLTTNPDTIVAGQPATLILNVKQADNDMNIMHPDALITIKNGLFTELASAPAGSPMMPMNGAFHGHTGEIAVTTVFPSPGMYTISMKVNSLPVSNYIFGHVSTSFRVFVSDSTGGGQSSQLLTTPVAPNEVSILGQFAPFYNPNNLSVRAGSTVTFKNTDAIMHTATGTSNGPDVKSPTPNKSFDTDVLKGGEEKQVTFDKPGTYNYFCQIHPFMRGTVTVTG